MADHEYPLTVLRDFVSTVEGQKRNGGSEDTAVIEQIAKAKHAVFELAVINGELGIALVEALSATPATGLDAIERWANTHHNDGKVDLGSLRDFIKSQRNATPATGLDVDRLMDAEHMWCVQVDGEYALRHEVETHRKHAEFIRAALAKEPTDDR